MPLAQKVIKQREEITKLKAVIEDVTPKKDISKIIETLQVWKRGKGFSKTFMKQLKEMIRCAEAVSKQRKGE